MSAKVEIFGGNGSPDAGGDGSLDETLERAASIYIRVRSIKYVELELSLPPGSLQSLLSDPTIEERFNGIVEEAAKRQASRLIAASIPSAINLLANVVTDGSLESPKEGVSAARALIELWLKVQKTGDDDALDKLFKEAKGEI